MAAITGSTAIDWSTVSLGQVDFAAHIVQASNRSNEIGAELESGNWSLVSASPTRIVVDLFSGGRVTLGGSRFNTSNPVLRSVSFANPVTGEILRYTGFSNGAGNGSLTSLTYGTTSFSETFIGNVTTFENDPNNQNDDTYAGPVTSLTARVGAVTVTLSGSLTLTGDDVTASLTGSVTGISVVSGANTIKMTGLAIDVDVIEAAFADNSLSTVNDLFSVVGNQLNGADVITYTNNSAVGMSFFGGAGNDTIIISGLRGDTLNGGDGNDILAGGLGQDTVNGGAGNDQVTMLVTAGNVDTIDAGADTDMLVLSGVVGGNGLVVVDLSAADQVVSIAGDSNRDTQVQTGFEGVNGLLLGSSMTVTGSAGDNVLVGSKGNDTLDGGDGHDTLLGGAGNDTLTGGVGNDLLDGGLGSDNMTGGLGDDTYVIDNLLDTITELDNEGIDTVQINRSVDLNVAPFTEIENAVLTGIAALNATGNGDDNSLTGNSAANILNGDDGIDTLIGLAGNDTLNGGLGDDAMDGGAGNDTYVVDSVGDTVTESVAGAAGGVDLVQSAVDFTLGLNVENLTLTGTDHITGTGNGLNNILTGNSGNNALAGLAGNDTLLGGDGHDALDGGEGNDVLQGGNGNDTLDGGAGTDTVAGGLGDDTYTVDLVKVGTGATATVKLADTLTEGLNQGTDTVILRGVVGDLVKATTLTVGANLEHLDASQTGATKLTLTGNTLHNQLTGNDADNLLAGLAGNDTLNGGAGNDTLDGGLGQDSVNGGTGNDVITMLVTAGNVDTIDAGDGTDMLVLSGVVGGNGLVVVDLSAADQVVSIAGDPNRDTQVQTGFEGVNGLLLGSSMTVTGSAGDNTIIGSKGNDTINGGAGHDTLTGGVGNDALNGGEGNDTYVIGQGIDVLTENLNEGTDTVQSSITHALGAHFENLTLTGVAMINGTGNELANVLTGNNAANILAGGDGNDTLIGNAGNDTLIGGAGQDTAQYSGGLSEYVLGTVGGMLTVTDRNRLNGNEGTDRVTGIEQLEFSNVTLTVTRGEVRVSNTNTVPFNLPSAVAGLANGGYVVTWMSFDGPFSLGIYAQRYTTQGERVGSPTRVNTTTTGSQEDNAVAGLANGGYVVTWTSSDVSFAADIYAQRYDTQGARVGSQTRINTTTTGYQRDSAVTGLANGGYVVTWTSSDVSSAPDIYAQRYSAQGARVGSATPVNTTTTGSQEDSAVAGLANGGYVVTWTSTTPDFSESIYAQRYTAQGVPVGGETLVNTTTTTDPLASLLSDSAVAGLANGGYVVTWKYTDQAFSTSVYAQRYDAQGVPVGGETLVNSTTPADAEIEIAVAGLADGGYLVSWTSSSAIYTQRYDAQGVPVGSETLVNSTMAGSMRDGAVAGLANGGYAVTWTVEDFSFFSGIYAQPYDAQGEALGGYMVTGTDGADRLTVGIHTLLTVDGAGGNDILTGGASADRLLGGDGNDVLNGGAGADTQQGGAGEDLFLLGSVGELAAGEYLDGGADTDTLRYTGTAGTLTLTYLVRNIEQVQIADAVGSSLGTGAVNINATNVSGPLTITGNNGANVLTGTEDNDTLVGNGGNDTLNGSLGNDTLNGGVGNDVLVGGVGNDTYQINSGAGQDRIVENDDTSGNSDSLVYGSAIDPADLVLSRQVNDLRIAVQGTTDRVTIVGWYADPVAAQIETIEPGVGQTLLNSQVDQLIQAMAQFTTNTGLSWDAAAGGAGTAQQQTDFQNIIAAAWQ